MMSKMMLQSKLGCSSPYGLRTIHTREGRSSATIFRSEKLQRYRQKLISAELAFDASKQRELETGDSRKDKKLGGERRDVKLSTRNRSSDLQVAGRTEEEEDSGGITVHLERKLRASSPAEEIISGLPKTRELFAKQSININNSKNAGAAGRKTHIFPVKKPIYIHLLALFCDVLEGIYLLASQGLSKPANYYMLGNYAPVEEFGPERVLSVKGELPECLNGEFVRAGPNPKFEAVAGYHWFDGDGMLHGLRIKDGKVTYVSRYVKTARLAQEEYWGGPKFDRIGDMVGRKGLVAVALYQLRVKLDVLDVSNGSFQANTSLAYHNGRLLTLNEADKPYVIRVLEDGDLETISRHDYNKKLNHSFTAHPKIDPDTGEMFTFGYQVDTPPYVTYRVISKDGVMGDPVPITISAPIMMHDFAITENYAIFMDLPIFFRPEDMFMKNQFIFSYDETKPARFGVLSRYAKNESQICWFELSSCLIFHNANAWEEGDDVVLISCRSPYLDFGAISVHEKSMVGKTDVEMWEYRFNMKTGNAMERKLADIRSDFPRINDEYVGRKNRFVYTGIFQDTTRIIGVVKYDLTLEPKLGEGKPKVGGNIAGLFWHGHKRAGSEPVFVPKNHGREGDEDEGYLLTFVFDESRLVSEVVVIDAKTMSPDPVAVIELPARVPYAFHALFVPEAELQFQKS
ncbi:unnamed protein product [Calypogeia fissa]